MTQKYGDMRVVGVGCEVVQRVANPKGLSYGNTSEVLTPES